MNNLVYLKPKTKPCPLCGKVLPATYTIYPDGGTSWGVGWHKCIKVITNEAQ